MRHLLASLRNKKSVRKNQSRATFPGSAKYWEQRYAAGWNSGVGSYDDFAGFKAEVLNQFVNENAVHSVIEFGCGDGNQLRLTPYPDYLGFDVSQTAVNTCEQLFAQDQSKRFKPMSEYAGEKADLTLSLDVIYHLIEDSVFHDYMSRLFAASGQYVGIYSSNGKPARYKHVDHIKHRKFTDWVQANQPEWRLRKHIPNRHPFRGDHTKGSFADFYFYDKGNN